MTPQKFKILSQSLYDKGYKKYNQQWHNEDYVIGKSFLVGMNRWEENRAPYIITLAIYDYTLHPEFFTRLPDCKKDRVGISIYITVSRTIEEVIEMQIGWIDDTTTIEEVESTAKSFYEFICKTYPEPRKYE